MPDDLSKRGPADQMRVNIHELWEVKFWCARLDCDEAELRACVEKVGPMVEDVRECIENERADTQR